MLYHPVEMLQEIKHPFFLYLQNSDAVISMAGSDHCRSHPQRGG